MKLRTIVIGTGLVVLALFAILNWETFSRATSLNIVVARVDAPLGVVLLFAIGALTLIYAVSLAKLELAALIKARRVQKDMDNLRQIADQSEQSRVQALQDFLIRETQRIDVKLDMLLESAKQQSAAARIAH